MTVKHHSTGQHLASSLSQFSYFPMYVEYTLPSQIKTLIHSNKFFSTEAELWLKQRQALVSCLDAVQPSIIMLQFLLLLVVTSTVTRCLIVCIV